MSNGSKPIANIGITCGEAASNKNTVHVGLVVNNPPELGIVINGKALETLAKK